MKKVWIWISCILLLIAIAVTATLVVTVYLPAREQAEYEAFIERGYAHTGNQKNAINQHAEFVSMLELVSTPEKYYGKLVCVVGVGCVDTSHPDDHVYALYLSKEDYLNWTWNALEMKWGPRAMSNLEAGAYNGKYVIVQGFFEKTEHPGYFGAITEVSRYDLARSETEWNTGPAGSHGGGE
jgi:hypothetical protein